MEYQIGKGDCDKDTQFINRHYHARKSVLQRFVIAEPGTAGCKSRQNRYNPSSLLSILPISFCLPFANTMIHAIKSTTAVRIAVPRLELSPSMPILPE